ncbi:MAG: hypothetical protein IH628_01915, partial [Proteobacteria bacterium]|nr:hypothetical protein [Pseudomonadota bacterium]
MLDTFLYGGYVTVNDILELTMALEEAYQEIRRIPGIHTESLESVRLVEAYRRYFKPKAVRVLLLAESHVFTSDKDRQITIPRIAELPGYPRQYTRFVYCLGYGEKDLTNDHLHPRWDGTPQFWKILFACENRIEKFDDVSPILCRTPFPKRLRNKIDLLKRLYARGVWLVDASIYAVYGKGLDISATKRTAIIRT